LFNKMVENLGVLGEKLVKHGMLVEHDFGRLYVKNLEEALKKVKAGDEEAKLDLIANAISYCDLLTRHIDKEDRVVYTFAKRELKEETGLDLLDVNNDYTIEKTYLSPGMTDESIALVFCTCDGELNKDGLEDDEDIEAILVSKEEARKILKSKEKMDVKAFLMLQNFVLLGEKMFV
ncbi:MAG: hypothetical protein Q607_CBUC00100G0001, partial [Clostridium butyricum DORA_1]